MSMDALIQDHSSTINSLKFNDHSISVLPEKNHVNGFKYNHGFNDLSGISNGSIAVDETPLKDDDISVILNGSRPFDEILSKGDLSIDSNGSSSVGEIPSEGDASEEADYSDEFLKYINQMLMEEDDLERRPCMLSDCLAVLAAEKSFYDIIGEKYPPSDSQGSDLAGACSSHSSNSSADVNSFVESDWIRDPSEFELSFSQSSHVNDSFESILQPMPSFGSSNGLYTAFNESNNLFMIPYMSSDAVTESQFGLQLSTGKVTHSHRNDNYFNYDPEPKEETSKVLKEAEESGRDHSTNGTRGKKNLYRVNSDYVEEGRSNKHLATYAEESEQSEMYDKVLLCASINPGLHIQSNMLQQNEESKGSNRGRPRGKKQSIRKEVVDLRSLLTQCAQAVASYDIRTANELLKRIRQHSSPCGDGTERLAHYFANALAARIAGTGTTLYTNITSTRISAADILKAYQVYISACPFKKMSNIFANKSIRILADGTTRLHIIDFGILYGFQWPCLIQHLSVRPGGPPNLRITGIDFPQSGFRPAERVEATGQRLKNYCNRFNVPFEYNAIAMKWDAIRLEDLNIDRDELLVVNCLYRLENVADETVAANNPREAVLNLVRRINPDMFIHGVVNGTYNTPFFSTRFREAIFHFSSLFDMFDAAAPREDEDRMRFEKEVFGRDVMNIIACEGTERIERPETYKQWQVRNLRTRFKQLPLNEEVVNCVRNKVKSCYHKDFVVEEDGKWMLQGWRGRVIYALSCWKPITD